MSDKFNALWIILNKLDRKEKVTARSLMEDLEVSERSVYRYITTLQVSGFPIDYDRSINSYVFSEGYTLKKPNVSVEGTLALVLSRKLLRISLSEKQINANTKLGVKTFMWIPLQIVIIIFCLLFLGCDPSKIPTKEVSPESKISSTIVKKYSNRWSNNIIWGQLVDNQSCASFSLTINDSLPKFVFKIHGTFKYSKRLQGNFFHPSHIEIIDSSTGKNIQKIENKRRFDNNGDGYDKLDLEFSDFVQMIDLNLDGYLDLRILHNTGATGNNWYATFLYDPPLRQFIFHEALSRLSGVTVDQKTKLVITYWRDGSCNEFREYFHLGKTGMLILEKVEWTEMDNTNSSTGCFKFTATPYRTRMLDRLGETFYNTDDDRFKKMLHTRVEVVRKEEFDEDLDGRKRGTLGNPLDRVPMAP